MTEGKDAGVTGERGGTRGTLEPFAALAEAQTRMMGAMMEAAAANPFLAPPADGAASRADWWTNWLAAAGGQRFDGAAVDGASAALDPSGWQALMANWVAALPLDPERQRAMLEEARAIWDGAADPDAELPRRDRRFADPAWEQPAYALLQQSYLWLGERIDAAIGALGASEAETRRLRFAARAMHDALSPANFPATNPVVLRRAIDSGGETLARGAANLATDLERGQLTHTDPGAFRLGENLATTPGKVVHETPLYQLIQYSPTTDEVFETPLVIFPPWINRFYILDLNPQKSFVRWAVDQGLTVFMVSWKSADETMKDIVWDDYIAAQIDAIDHVCDRLDEPDVHTIGYCVAGTTLAATLAVLAAKGEADKVRSATFFTAQVDFSNAGDLLHFVDDAQIDAIERIGVGGVVDGRYLAAAFNLLRGADLIWNYVVNHYLLGEDYPAFDLLHWNGDVTNLPAGWHASYLRDLYRDNKLIEPGAMEALGEPIDLTRVETPTYVQAGKEDHIAPAESVWKITEHLSGPVRFVLAGSGHIAGVVNPPDANKYQHWVHDGSPASLDAFREEATERPGSWWPDWIDWIASHGDGKAPATGKRAPGGDGDAGIEDAPGRYVMAR